MKYLKLLIPILLFSIFVFIKNIGISNPILENQLLENQLLENQLLENQLLENLLIILLILYYSFINIKYGLISCAGIIIYYIHKNKYNYRNKSNHKNKSEGMQNLELNDLELNTITNFDENKDKVKDNTINNISPKLLSIEKANEIIRKIKNIDKSVDDIANTTQVIPLNIFQTWETHELPPKMKECVEKLKSANPEFTFYLYNDAECREFIKNNFSSDVLYAYDTLIPGAYKADLWRYCILYKYGGIYLDIKYYPVNGFKFMTLTDKEYFVKERNRFAVYNKKGIYNALLICKPKNNILLKCINQIAINVREQFYGNNDLGITGPLLINQYFTNEQYKKLNLEYCYSGNCITNDNNVILKQYPEYYDEQKQYNNKNLPRYGVLWKTKQIYKKYI